MINKKIDINKLIKIYEDGGNKLKILHMKEVGENFYQPDMSNFVYNSSDDNNQSKWYTEQNFNYSNQKKEEYRLRKFRIFHYFMQKYGCKSVFDVGFGSGYHTWNSAVNGYDTLGADFKNGAYHIMNDMIEQSNIKNLELLPFYLNSVDVVNSVDRRFDAVLSIEVLEHILDPMPLHEAQIKLCDKVFFCEEYCGDRTVTGHIAPHQAKQDIVTMCNDYGFTKIHNPYGYPPDVYIKNELL